MATGRGPTSPRPGSEGFGILRLPPACSGPQIGIPYVSLWTALMGAFVYRTATAEQRMARLVGNFGGLHVRDVMLPDPETVRGWNTVQAVLAEFDDTPPRHEVLPVVAWEGGICGVVTLEQLTRTDPATHTRCGCRTRGADGPCRRDST